MHKERRPNRLNGYDYSSDNLYFITSCVQDRMCCFGNIVVSTSVGTGRDLSLQRNELQQHDSMPQMVLNDYGKIAYNQWHWLEQQYPYVVLHAFVVMPNHVHGIIQIESGMIRNTVGVGTGRDLSLQQRYALLQPEIKIKPLSELIGAYKTTVSKQIHQSGLLDFKWQRSFHDHIIRNAQSYENISNYILNNPATWKEDVFHTP